jgi:competence protein ComEC
MHRPVITIALAYAAGILLGHGFLYFPFSIIVILVLSLLGAGIATWAGKLSLRRSFILAIPCVVGVAAYIYAAAWFPQNHYTRVFFPARNARLMTGIVDSPLERSPGRTAFVLRLLDIDGIGIVGRIRMNVHEELTSLGYGDRIRVSGVLFEPRGFNNPGGFDYPAYLARSGVYTVVYVKNAEKIQILNRGKGIFRAVQDWRERIRQAYLASTTGQGSAIIQAMVLGEEGGLTDDIRDQFMAAGVTHILSISGSHLGMVAVLCFGLIRGLLFLMPERFYHRLTLFTDPKKIAAWLTFPIVFFYTLLSGGQIATFRSLVMITAGLAALILDREHALMQVLAIAALLILGTQPQAVFDISFQLSFLSVFVISAVVHLWTDLKIEAKTPLQKSRNTLVLLMIISLSTSLATGPLVAHYFNQISFIGILSNIVVVPFAGMVVVPLGLFSGILSLVTHHLPLAGVTQSVADAFIAIVAFFADLPFAEFHPPSPGILWLLFAAIFLFSFFGVVRAWLLFLFRPFENSARLSKGSLLGMAIGGSALLLLSVYASLPTRRTEIIFPDVGQGDCALVELASGKTILVDSGGTLDNKFDIGRKVVAPYLWNRGVHKLDLVVLSHPHPDHMNGLFFILKKFGVGEVWTTGRDTGLPGYAEFLRIVTEKGITMRLVSADAPSVMLGGAELRVLHPTTTFKPRTKRAYDSENNNSLVLRISDNKKVFLFPGDIGSPAEKYLIEQVSNLACDLLKVPHHGSKTSSTEGFVTLSRPKIAVVTVGRGNPYHHPADAVLARYERIGSRIFRTDIDGEVVIRNLSGRLDCAAWRTLILSKIDLNRLSDWKEREQENWRRLVIRTTGT